MHRNLVVLSFLLFGVSCSPVGPRTIPRDQFDYGHAIAGAGREQILKNIVGLRYVEAPVFVDVASVINQYALEGEIAAGAGLNTGISGGDTVTLGGAGRWADRPTITYTPVSGQKFAASLLTPLPPESLFALVQSGWPAELVLRMTVRSMNGVANEWAAPAGRRQADPEFRELLRVWRRLRDGRVVGLRRSGESGKEQDARIVVYVNPEHMTEGLERDLEFLYDTLGLEPGLEEARLSYGLVPDQPNEIKVLTTSILQLMNELAWRMEVPSEHVEEGRTLESFVPEGSEFPPLVRISHAEERPDYAFVAVRSRDRWFFIDDRDVRSKRTFALVQILLSLTDTGDVARGPVVSLTN